MSEPGVFMDTSALFAAVLSPGGGARAILIAGEMALVSIWVGRRVLQEADEVLKRKAPELRSTFAVMLREAGAQVGPDPDDQMLVQARRAVSYEPDASVLAEALAAHVEFLVTHDKEHFLRNAAASALGCRVVNPRDLLAILRSRFDEEAQE